MIVWWFWEIFLRSSNDAILTLDIEVSSSYLDPQTEYNIFLLDMYESNNLTRQIRIRDSICAQIWSNPYMGKLMGL
jgi:hypothetical protein